MPITLDGTNGITTPTYGGADTSEYLVPVTAFKNRIINGNMSIDQRNAGASVTPTTDSTYTLDRWLALLSTSSKYSVQQQSSIVPTSFRSAVAITSLAATSLAAGDYYGFGQRIEGFNTSDLMWGTANAQTVTLSFWVRSSLSGTFGGAIGNNAFNRSYPFTYTISSANTWEQKSITIAGDTTGTWGTTNNIGLYVYFGLGVGSTYSGTAGSWTGSGLISSTGATSVVGTNGATFYITGVQLEVGSTATSFDYRPYGTELALCQRYFESCFPIGTAPAQNTGAFSHQILAGNSDGGSLISSKAFWVIKRASPTITYYNPAAANANFGNGGAVSVVSIDATGMYVFTTTTTGARTTVNWAANAEL